ncbi:MAG: hypothetical protein ACQ9MH_10885 [Nitrospinales bacterium]
MNRYFYDLRDVDPVYMKHITKLESFEVLFTGWNIGIMAYCLPAFPNKFIGNSESEGSKIYFRGLRYFLLMLTSRELWQLANNSHKKGMKVDFTKNNERLIVKLFI